MGRTLPLPADVPPSGPVPPPSAALHRIARVAARALGAPAARPGTRALLISGYTGYTRAELADAPFAVLPKPVAPDDLLRRVAQTLEEGS